MKRALGFLILLVLNFQTAFAAATLIGPKGRVVLFFQEAEDVVVRFCELDAIVESIQDCQKFHSEWRSPIRKMKKHLWILAATQAENHPLAHTSFYYPQSFEEQLKELEKRMDARRTELAQIEAYGERYGHENARTDEADTLRALISNEDQLKAQLEEMMARSNEFISDTKEIIGQFFEKHLLGDEVRLESEFKYSERHTCSYFSLLQSYMDYYRPEFENLLFNISSDLAAAQRAGKILRIPLLIGQFSRPQTLQFLKPYLDAETETLERVILMTTPREMVTDPAKPTVHDLTELSVRNPLLLVSPDLSIVLRFHTADFTAAYESLPIAAKISELRSKMRQSVPQIDPIDLQEDLQNILELIDTLP